MTNGPIESWPKPAADADHVTIVYDAGLGCIAELVTDNGDRFYGVDPVGR